MSYSTTDSSHASTLNLSSPIRFFLGVILAAISAILLTLSMPPYGIWVLALIGLVPMILAQYRILPPRFSSLAPSVTIGGLVALYIMDAFLQLPNAPWFMRILPLIFAAVIFLTDHGTRAFHERTQYRWLVLSGALGWVGVELIRSLIPVLGTWGFVAYAYYKQPQLIQPVSIFGIFGLSLINLLFSYALGQYVLAWFDQRWRVEPHERPVNPQRASRWLLGTSIAFGMWVLLSLVMYLRPTGETVRVAAVQPNFKALWTPEEIATNSLSTNRYQEIYGQLFKQLLSQTTSAGRHQVQLIVWPEGALNFDPQYSHSQTLRALVANTNAYLVIPYGVDFRNEVTVLSPQGEFLGIYGKNHPVTFVGERSVTGGSYPAFPTEFGNLGAIICYDMDFTDTARNVAKNGVSLIAVPSGDWPGIADKHYAHLVFRAIENRVAMVKADRSYDSVIIGPYGDVIKSTISKESKQDTLVADLPVVDKHPLQLVIGDGVGWTCLGGLVIFAVYTPLSSHKRQASNKITDEETQNAII